MRRGLALEDQSAERGWELIRNTFGIDGRLVKCGLVVNPKFPFLGATPDRIIIGTEKGHLFPMEIKMPCFRGSIAEYAHTPAGRVNLSVAEVGVF